MAYTNTWSDNTPLGSASANTIDDSIRQLRLDLHERINSILGVAIGTALVDPITPAGQDLATLGSLFTTQTFHKFIHWSEGAWANTGGGGTTPADPIGTHGQYLIPGGTAWIDFQIGLGIPVGCTITGITEYWNSTMGADTPTRAFRSAGTSGSTSLIASISSAISGAGDSSVVVFSGSQVVASGTWYFYRIEPTGWTNNSWFKGISVDYTSPDANHRV